MVLIWGIHNNSLYIYLQVEFYIQPYRGQNTQSVHDNVRYIIDRQVHMTYCTNEFSSQLFFYAFNSEHKSKDFVCVYKDQKMAI